MMIMQPNLENIPSTVLAQYTINNLDIEPIIFNILWQQLIQSIFLFAMQSVSSKFFFLYGAANKIIIILILKWIEH